MEDRVVPALADGTLLVTTSPSSFASPDQSGLPAGIITIDPATGNQDILSGGPATASPFTLPTYIAEGPNGLLYVTDLQAFGSGAVFTVDPNTGVATVLAKAGLNGPNALAFVNGFLYVVNEGDGSGTIHYLVKLDPSTGQELAVIPGNFSIPTGMVPVPGQNAVYVADEQGSASSAVPPAGRVWLINLNTNAQTVVSSNNSTQGTLFHHPVDVAVDASGNIIVANTGDPTNNLAGSIIRINPQTGGQTLVTSFGPFSGTDSVEVGANGTIFVGAIAGGQNPAAVFAVNPATGATTTLASGGNLSLVEGMRTYRVVAQRAITTTSVSSSNNPSTSGQSITFTATISGRGPAAAPTGTVQWQVDGTNTGFPVAVSTSGGVTTAILTTSMLSVGTHTVAANYSGDGNFQPSAGSLQQTVNGTTANTTTTVTSSANPQAVGQPVSWTATVTAATGAVNFVNFETGDFSQAAAHLGGAIVTSPALDGAYSLQLQRSNSTAYYEIRQSGTTSYNLPTAYYSFLFESTSNPSEGGIVNFQNTAGALKAALHLSATNKLLFYDSQGTLLGTGTTVLASGQVYTLSAKIGTGGSAAWEVRINGNVELSGTGNLGTANNGSVRLGGNSPYTTTYYYDDVAINSQSYPGTPPTGTVQFAIDGVNFGGPLPLSGGSATSASTSTLTAGSHTITASYSGDSNFAASSGSLPGGQIIRSPSKATSSTTIVSLTNPSVFGQPITVTAAVMAVPPATGTPTGTVTFLDGGTALGTAFLTNTGQATFTIPTPLAAGSHALTAVYGGDNQFNASTSQPVTQVVSQGATTTTLFSSANPVTFGQPVAFTATVTANAPASGTPTGSATFVVDGTSQTTVPLSNGTAVFTPQNLFRGSHTIVAVYNGDGNFQASSSVPLSQSILFDSNQSFLYALYVDLLNRVPDQAGFTFWVAQLQAGMPRDQVVLAFWQSAEHRGLEVDKYYLTILGRNADAAGRQNWVNQLLAGVDESVVIIGFLTSSEFMGRYPDDAAFLRALYRVLLNREAADQEVIFWQQYLQSGTLSRAAVANAFLTSDEAFRNAVDQDYQTYLGRTETPQEQQGWVSALENGFATPASVAVAFLASDEYLARSLTRP